MPRPRSHPPQVQPGSIKVSEGKQNLAPFPVLGETGARRRRNIERNRQVKRNWRELLKRRGLYVK